MRYHVSFFDILASIVNLCRKSENPGGNEQAAVANLPPP
jgi:hypothetical protein